MPLGFKMSEGMSMRRCGWWIAAIILMVGSVAPAQYTVPTSQPIFDPFAADIPSLMVLPAQPPSVYAPIEPEKDRRRHQQGRREH